MADEKVKDDVSISTLILEKEFGDILVCVGLYYQKATLLRTPGSKKVQ